MISSLASSQPATSLNFTSISSLRTFGGGLSNTEESAHAPACAANASWAPPYGVEQEGDDEHGGQHAQEEGAADT